MQQVPVRGGNVRTQPQMLWADYAPKGIVGSTSFQSIYSRRNVEVPRPNQRQRETPMRTIERHRRDIEVKVLENNTYVKGGKGKANGEKGSKGGKRNVFFCYS